MAEENGSKVVQMVRPEKKAGAVSYCPLCTGRGHTSRSAHLAAWLLLAGAEVLAGLKPANLINVKNVERPCGTNLYREWKRFGRSLLRISGLSPLVLVDRGHSLLLMLYRPDTLADLLQRPDARFLLGQVGYPPDADYVTCLGILASRCRRESFPHEIGILLGYPLKDVAGFLGLDGSPYTCQGPWKIFGDPAPSLTLAAAFRISRQQMWSRLLASPVKARKLLDLARRQARLPALRAPGSI